MLCPHIPGRELLGEVATRRLWSVCKELGAVLLETTEEAGPAETPPSEALDLHTKMGALLSKTQGRYRRGPRGVSNSHNAKTSGFLIPPLESGL